MSHVAEHCAVCKTASIPNIHGEPQPCRKCEPERFRKATGQRLVKVRQASGNLSVYEAHRNRKTTDEVKGYGRLIATRFAAPGSVFTWRNYSLGYNPADGTTVSWARASLVEAQTFEALSILGEPTNPTPVARS